jgi:methyltransferase (TIGR00027 family)
MAFLIKRGLSSPAMLEREPSRTALAVASYRAAHQVLEEGRFFKDPLALPILGLDAEAIRQQAELHEARRGIRLFVAARSNIAEGAVRLGVLERRVGQLVVLGAGLDTFAYRNPFGDRLRVFEVDHPATQAWKRRRLQEAGVAVPESLTYAPVDFEREALSERLAAAGLDPGVRTVFTWLGVVPYLTGEAVASTLSQIAAHPAGAEVVFDYGEPREHVDPAFRQQYEDRAARVAAAGEPFLSYFVPHQLHAQLRGLGFDQIEDLDVPSLMARVSGQPAPPPAAARRSGGHVLYASTP